MDRKIFWIIKKKGLQFAAACVIISKLHEGNIPCGYAAVAQLDRVTDYESVGRGFESLLAYQKKGLLNNP